MGMCHGISLPALMDGFKSFFRTHPMRVLGPLTAWKDGSAKTAFMYLRILTTIAGTNYSAREAV